MKQQPHNLILQYNSMWGDSLQPAGLPDGWEFTTDPRLYHDADVVIFHLPSMHWFQWPLKGRRQRWVAWSMECDANYRLQRSPLFMSLFDATMTYRRSADVWVPYLPPDLPEALRTPVQPKPAGHLAAWFCRNARDRCGRKPYVRELMRHLDVHSYGPCLGNRSPGVDHGRSTKMETIARYKFTLAFENALADDYVTEKLFEPLLAGSVPVYRGAGNIADFLPGDRCIIDAAEFSGPRELAEYLLYLDNNDRAYAEYTAWRNKPLRASFVDMCRMTRESPLARLCQALAGRSAA